jgi:hypothetical protein
MRSSTIGESRGGQQGVLDELKLRFSGKLNEEDEEDEEDEEEVFVQEKTLNMVGLIFSL